MEIYTTIPPTPIMMDMIVKIIAESLTVLAVATERIKQGRFSKCPATYTSLVTQCATEKFKRKLLRESKIEAVLQRLDRLTQDDARITVAQTLCVIHGLVVSVNAVMEGAKCLHDSFRTFFRALLLLDGEGLMNSIWQDLGMCPARNKHQPC